jgi:hypothetical protein
VIHIIEVDRDHAVGSRGNFLAVVWRGRTSITAVSRCQMFLDNLKAEYPAEGVGLLQLAEPGAPPPDGAVRAAVSRLLASGAGSVKSSCLVYAGTGFYMASARALVTALTMLAKTSFPHEVFATVADAAAWHARLLPQVTPKDIITLVDRLVGELDRQTARATP